MSQETDLKALARRAYLSYHQDGLIDVLIGWMAFSFGLYLWLDSVVFSFFAWFPLLFYVPIKNTLTIPRLGYAKFSGDYDQKKRTRLSLVLIGILAVLVLAISLLVLVGPKAFTTQTSLHEYGMLVYGATTTLLLLIAAPLSSIGRLTAYGLLCAVLAIIGTVAGLPDHLLFLVLGLAILLVGAILMIRFIRKYPPAHKEADHDAE